MNKEKLLKVDKKSLIVIVAFVFIYLINFLPEHFALDTYFFQIEGYDANATVYMNAGRLVMVFFLKVMKYLTFDFFTTKIFSFAIATISLVLAAYVMKKIIDKKMKNDILNTIISLLIVVNIFVIEFFVFTEYTGIMCFSVLCSICASYEFVKYLDEKKGFAIILSSFLVLLSMLSYQGVASLFICASSIFLIKYFNNIKSFIKYNFIMGFVYGIPAILAFLMTRISGSERTSISGNDFGLSFEKIFTGLKNLVVSSSNFMPKYIFLVIILILIVIVLMNLIKAKKNLTIFYFIYFLFLCIFFTVLPQFMIGTDIIWVVARSNMAIGALVGLIILFYCLYCDNNEKVLKHIYAISIVVFLFQYIGWQQIIKDHYIVNVLDREYAYIIVEKINEYETETKNVIKYINYYNDKHVSYDYLDTRIYGDINIRVFAIDWARGYVIDYYSGRNYKSYDNKEYRDYCQLNDWNHFDKEQLQFYNDTLNICIY